MSRQSSFAEPKVNIVEVCKGRLLIEWKELDEGRSTRSTSEGDAIKDLSSQPQRTTRNAENDVGQIALRLTADGYDALLDLAYTRLGHEPDTKLDEEIADIDNGEDMAEIKDALPTDFEETYVVQQFIPRRGWTTVFRGRSTQCLIEGLFVDQTSLFRLGVCRSNDQPHELWDNIQISKSGGTEMGTVGAAELFEGAAKGNSSYVATVIRKIKKNAPASTLDACAEEGLTSAVSCAMHGGKEAFAMLLEGGAGKAVPSAGPQVTPMHLAAWAGHESITARLEAAGVTWWDKDKCELTSFEYAVMNCQNDIVRGVIQNSDWLNEVVLFHEPILSWVAKASALNGLKFTSKAARHGDVSFLVFFVVAQQLNG